MRASHAMSLRHANRMRGYHVPQCAHTFVSYKLESIPHSRTVLSIDCVRCGWCSVRVSPGPEDEHRLMAHSFIILRLRTTRDGCSSRPTTSMGERMGPTRVHPLREEACVTRVMPIVMLVRRYTAVCFIDHPIEDNAKRWLATPPLRRVREPSYWW